MDHDGQFTPAERANDALDTDASPASAVIIRFPIVRRPIPSADAQPVAPRTATTAELHTLRHVDNASLAADLITLVLRATADKTEFSGPTTLGALGAVAGFAAQQSLLLRGPTLWHQPMRAAHLDRMMVSDAATDMSLWHQLKAATATHGTTQLPDPKKLLAVTQKCLGTNQFGVIILPPAHRLSEQPQTGLIRLWARVRDAFDAGRIPPETWPVICSRAAAAAIAGDLTKVPVHVAVRIIMQAALAMALVEPRQIPGAAVKCA
ncbi:MAG: hypothetical protein ABL898_14105 [Hyphomicrobiaceae bacterium]